MIVGIVGLGLIGASLALELRSRSALEGEARSYQVLGVSRRAQTCQLAIERGIVDDASENLSLLAAAQIVFICTPIAAIAPTVKQLIPHLSPEVIITDVGSVKKPIVEAVTPIWPNFVGGHPMAGTASSGIDAAQPHLFVGAPYVLTPVATTPPESVNIVAQIARSLQSQVYFCTPEDHDRAVAWISHLPVMVSASLIRACLSETNPDVLELAQHLASSGFRDTSRVGGGNPELGVMMAQYNQTALLRSLQHYRQCLDEMIARIEQEDWTVLEHYLKQNQQARPKFLPQETTNDER